MENVNISIFEHVYFIHIIAIPNKGDMKQIQDNSNNLS